MKKVAAFVALSLLIAGCVSNDKIAVTQNSYSIIALCWKA
ncbi:heat-inducible protein [Escherichia coli]|uniref:Heat-inducible protein n=1 Tax=Escherichia coli TaxID=562 RepID=A0A376MY39_ECOLX|nr:heat-inducible protein [Escherichia coli]